VATRILVLTLVALAASCSCRKETDLQAVDTDLPSDGTASGDDDDGSGTDDPGDDAPEDWGQWLSGDVAPDGDRLSLAYYDAPREAIGYALVGFDAEGNPVTRHERVDGYSSGDNDVGRYASQVTDVDGSAWVVYHDADDGLLKARHRTGTSEWGSIETVGDGGKWANVALDADDRLMVAHTADDGVLRVSRRINNAWQTEEVYQSAPTDWTSPEGVVTTRPAEVAQPRIYVDGATTHIAFYDKARGELHLLSGSYGNFRDELVRASGDEGAWPSMVASGGSLHIAYQHVGDQDLVLATRNPNGNWSFQVVDDGQLVGSDTEIFVHDGKVHILYFQGFDSDLYLAVDDGGWQISRLEGGATATGFHNETVEVGGKRWIATYDYTDRGVIFLPLE
jgi:hypothetical protein